jgi:hypothetical protein
MLPAQSPAGLDREQALEVLEQLERCLVGKEHERRE